MMRSCFTTLACPDWTLEQLIKSATELGFDGVELRGLQGELDLWKTSEFQGTELSHSHQLISDAGLEVPCIGTSICLHHRGPALRLSDVERNCEIASALGTRAIRVFPDVLVEGHDRAQTLQIFAETLARLRETTGDIDIWLETHGDFARREQVEELFGVLGDAAPLLIWDPANAFAAVGEQPMLTELLRERLAHVHLKDILRDATSHITNVLPGTGTFDLTEMMRQLRDAKYEGYVSFEWEKRWHPELVEAEIALPAYMQWWKTVTG